MERPKNIYFILTLVFLLLLTNQFKLHSTENANSKAIYAAYINRNMDKWASIINDIETNSPPKTITQKTELISYYYGYTAYVIGKKQYNIAEKLIVNANRRIEEILKQNPNNATVLSYKGSFIGFRIGVSRFKALYLGRESVSNINKSIEIDPLNIQGNIDRGNIYYYSPGIFGGDKFQALKYYRKAIEIMEHQNKTDFNWLYLNLLTNTALAYEKTDQHLLAKQLYEKILKKEPNFHWVKIELYPRLLEKMK